MIIPSIDIQGGKAVQLRQGKELVLTDERDPVELARLFNRYGEIAVIDLDAAMGTGDNLELVKQICRVADVRAGGGIRTPERAKALLRAGAKRIIIGTAATPEFLSPLPVHRVMVAIDHKDGTVVDKGWTASTGEDFLARAQRLSPYCGSFLCTFVTTEGTLSGMDHATITAVRDTISHPITVAGGAANTEEVISLSKLGVDVQVGMGLYTGRINPIQAVTGSLDFEKCPHIPTIVQDMAGEVLMLAYSTPESLTEALETGKGIYYSRSRQSRWEKGATSGHTQRLIRCRTDCDRDTLLFTVEQTGPACHTEAHSCFGSGMKDQIFSLHKLFQTLKERKTILPEGSYTAKLFQNRELLLRKLMEEAFEVTQANNREELTWEIADTLFFMSVLAVDENIAWDEIIDELGGRSQ